MRIHRHDPDDPEQQLGRRDAGLAGLPMFDAAPAWPTSAPIAAGTRSLPLPTTVQARYEAWQQTEDYALLFAEIRAEAKRRAALKPERIGVKSLCEHARDTVHRPLDNRFTALLGRSLYEAEESVRPFLTFKKRLAA